MFFFLDEKERKNQGLTKFAEIQLRYAKNDKLTHLKFKMSSNSIIF